ncbi:hypothetical protein [Streptomyces sp. NRRL S-350]|uniref:hypothetical protein n=1 Tax=Streptomyces sp. NRRL S-350 TaxID=1463902 RepID=UPI0004C02248|nr:hypothetical protein [Streptomyces sp. NRRL S-350]
MAGAKGKQRRDDFYSERLAAAANPMEALAVELDRVRAVFGKVPDQRQAEVLRLVQDHLRELRATLADYRRR